MTKNHQKKATYHTIDVHQDIDDPLGRQRRPDFAQKFNVSAAFELHETKAQLHEWRRDLPIGCPEYPMVVAHENGYFRELNTTERAASAGE